MVIERKVPIVLLFANASDCSNNTYIYREGLIEPLHGKKKNNEINNDIPGFVHSNLGLDLGTMRDTPLSYNTSYAHNTFVQ